MHQVEFEGQTHLFGPPEGWDNETKSHKCDTLPALVTEVEGNQVIYSVWKPDQQDLAILVAGGHIVLGVVGGALPPVSLHVSSDIQELP